MDLSCERLMELELQLKTGELFGIEAPWLLWPASQEGEGAGSKAQGKGQPAGRGPHLRARRG